MRASTRSSPADAPVRACTFTVATRETLLAEGFEGAATGWTHGGRTSGRSDAFALTEDPAAAYTGLEVRGHRHLRTRRGARPLRELERHVVRVTGGGLLARDGVKLSFARKFAVERSNGGAWDYARACR